MKVNSICKNEYSNSNNHYVSIDVYKLIMSVCVVAIHTHALSGYDNIFAKCINLIIWSAVPFFFMSSGFLIAEKTKYLDVDEELKVIGKAIKKYIVIYILCSVAYLPLSLKAYSGRDIISTVSLYVRDFLFVGQHRDDWIMWYLLSSIYAFVFLYMIVRVRLNTIEMMLVLGMLMLVSFSMDILVAIDDLKEPIIIYFKEFLSLTTQDGRVLRGLFFVPIGWLISRSELNDSWGGKIERIYLWSMLLLTAVGSIASESYLSKNLFLSVFSMILFFRVTGLTYLNRMRRMALYFRQLSKIIFFTHMYVFVLVSKYIWGEKRFGIKSTVTVVGVASVLGCVVLLFFRIVDNYNHHDAKIRRN